MRPSRTERQLLITRRRVLGSALFAASASLAARFGLTRIAHAQNMAPRSNRRFLFCYFPGGWDQLLFLDPRDPMRFPDQNRATTLIEPRYGSLSGYDGFSSMPYTPTGSALGFGPVVTQPNVRMVLDRLVAANAPLSIVRGIMMSTLSHERAYHYFLTAKLPSGDAARGSSLATELAAGLNGTHATTVTPIPSLALGIESYNDHYPGTFSAVQVQSVEDLGLVLQRPGALQEIPTIEQALDEYAGGGMPCQVGVYDSQGLLSRYRNARVTGSDLLSRNLALYFAFLSEPAMNPPNGTTIDAMTYANIRNQIIQLRSSFGFSSGDTIDPESPAARAMFAVQAITAKIAQCVSVTIGVPTDTHQTGNPQHAVALVQGVQALFSIIDVLRTTPAPADVGTGSWLDNTTIVAFSEFARTPLFNQFGGRDHHMCNSCLIAGAGIAPGKVVGASTDVGMAPSPYDFTTGRLADGGDPIKPENIEATLLASAGLDPTASGASPLMDLLA